MPTWLAWIFGVLTLLGDLGLGLLGLGLIAALVTWLIRRQLGAGRDAVKGPGRWQKRLAPHRRRDVEAPPADLVVRAEAGEARACFELAEHWDRPGGDEREALRWYRRASEAGDLKAIARLAVLGAVHGLVDPAESVRLLRRAAEAGEPEAQHNLGLALREGLGVAPDPDQATRWLTRASQAGHRQAGELLQRLNSDA
jgi:TPR repeat protein